MYYKIVNSPLGDLTLVANEQALQKIVFGTLAEDSLEEKETTLLNQAEDELQKYFKGTLKKFAVPVKPQGSYFQMAVWDYLKMVPYGDTISYGQVAKAIGNPKAVRAVGQANNKNPIPIIIPCHRVVGKDGSLIGYSGKLENKKKLLDMEGLKP
ncbi:methylated-DNA--[protein]-cysteine S-methyltransferase [Proteinivorax hydrogeniformans]|uniref:Methylated-DNA--protein-cysteine methyltransferase n=1 Tax=Proteinivorax hydrogeniformans TaxID=1826727 RepID=A0AAU8HVU1_9FIRM